MYIYNIRRLVVDVVLIVVEITVACVVFLIRRLMSFVQYCFVLTIF